MPKATLGQVRRPGRHAGTWWGCDHTHHLSQGHARREEIPKAKARIGKAHLPLLGIPFGPPGGTFVHRMPVLEGETLLPKNSIPHWSPVILGSYLPESPTALEMWVGWGQAGAGACFRRKVRPPQVPGASSKPMPGFGQQGRRLPEGRSGSQQSALEEPGSS